MNTVFSTEDVHQRDAFDYCHEILCKKIIRHDCRPQTRRPFHAKVQSASLADIDLVRYESAPMQYDVTERHLAHANADELLVRRQIAGVFVVEQDSREAVLQPGDFTLLDTRRPIRGRFLEGTIDHLVLKVPRRQLEARIGDVRSMIARKVAPSKAEHSLTSAYLAMLPNHVDDLGAVASEIIRDQTLDLVAVSLAKAMDAGIPRVSSAHSLALFRVRAAIEARLFDPALDAKAVAASAGVSVRYANTVLAKQGTSITRLIWARRLERCRRALQDESQRHRTIGEIAYSWGFSDLTHFGRSFRQAYGSLPSEYRRLAK